MRSTEIAAGRRFADALVRFGALRNEVMDRAQDRREKADRLLSHMTNQLETQHREKRLQRRRLRKSVAKFDRWMADYLHREGLKPAPAPPWHSRASRPSTAPAPAEPGAALGDGTVCRGKSARTAWGAAADESSAMLASLWHAMDGCDGEKRRGHLSRSGWGLGLAAVAIGRQAAGGSAAEQCCSELKPPGTRSVYLLTLGR
eukprot:g29060.t1